MMRRAKPRSLAIVLIMTCTALIVSAWALYSTGRANRDLTNCITAWADATSAAQKPRIAATERRDDALEAIIRAVGDQDQDAILTAIRRYEATADELTRERAANPYPAPPAILCEGAS